MRINSELLGAQLENLSGDLTPATTDKGRIGFRSTTTPIQVSDGATVHRVLTDQMDADVADLVEGLVEIDNDQVSANYTIGASDSGSFLHNSTSYADVTNLTGSITTSGKPVEVTLIGDRVSGSGTGAPVAVSLKLLRGASEVYVQTLSAAGPTNPYIDVPASSFKWIDEPAAGTHTYKIQVSTNSASVTAQLADLKIYIKEI